MHPHTHLNSLSCALYSPRAWIKPLCGHVWSSGSNIEAMSSLKDIQARMSVVVAFEFVPLSHKSPARPHLPWRRTRDRGVLLSPVKLFPWTNHGICASVALICISPCVFIMHVRGGLQIFTAKYMDFFFKADQLEHISSRIFLSPDIQKFFFSFLL